MAGKSCPVRALDMTRSSAPLSDSHFGENWAYHKRLGIALISGGRRVRDLTTHPWLARQNPSIGFQKATSQGTLRLSSPACLGAKQERSKIGRLTMFLAVHPYPGGSGSRETMQDIWPRASKPSGNCKISTMARLALQEDTYCCCIFSPWWQVHVLNCPCQWVCLDHFPEPGYTIIKVCILLKIPLPLAPSNQATRKSSVIHDWVGVGECTWMWICAFSV
ncbi:hypothetical protein AFUB_091910 [Aspergillus fumigatus A1163]|uniref:Uncharacterized protein n=1 Tax=Aspergillus fumigatus (strain CBS 144.89 / FGSC A1163 / CEA10) TaxID=451804 RepID=B0YB84_ASPFC|nr:hypothetical protein AFUB_091910 [Aspergillus fumigatus A1163]